MVQQKYLYMLILMVAGLSTYVFMALPYLHHTMRRQYKVYFQSGPNTTSATTTSISTVSTSTINATSSSTTSDTTTTTSTTSTTTSISNSSSSSLSTTSSSSSSTTPSTSSSTSTLQLANSTSSTLSTTTLNTTISTSSSTVQTTTTIGQSISYTGNVVVGNSKPVKIKPAKGGTSVKLGATKGVSMRELTIKFKNSTNPAFSSGFNISIVGGTTPPPQVPQLLGSGAYRYIQINESLATNSSSIDPYIQNVSYNFSIKKSWLSSMNAGINNVTMLKYAYYGWYPIPTVYTGQNATDYFYIATSPSLSTYAVALTITESASSTTPGSTVSLSSGFASYFYVGATGDKRATSSCTYAVNYIEITSNRVCATTGTSSAKFNNATDIGYNLSSNPDNPNLGNFLNTGGSTTHNNMIVGIGANVLFLNNGIEANTAPGSTNTLTFQVNTANSYVLLFFALGGNDIKSIQLPAGCTQDNVYHVKPFMEGVAIANCIPTTTGAMTTSFLPNVVTAKGANSIVALVFPPYNVVLDDYPGTGNILTLGVQQVSGNTVNTVGDGTVNAVVPSGHSFEGWYTDGYNVVNTIVNTPATKNTFLSVMGGAILTAGFWPNTYKCNCLVYEPSPTATNSVGSITTLTGINLASGFQTYFYAGTANMTGTGGTSTANWIISTSNSVAGDYWSFIGYNKVQTANILGTTVGNQEIVGVGTNVIFANNGFSRNDLTNPKSSYTENLLFEVNTPLSYVVLATTVSNSVLAPSNFILPAACYIQQIANAFPSDSAAIATCNSLPNGWYSMNVILPNPGYIQEQALVFPPANVFLKDNPGSGNVLTNTTQQVNGNEITVIGDNTVNAVIPSGDSFGTWSVDSANAANVSFASATSANSFVSIMGDGIITATYTLPSSCTTVVSNKLLDFGTVALGQSTSTTQNNVNVKNTGTATANIYLEGTSWQLGASSFLSQNTIWTSNDLGSTGKLTGTFVDTMEQAIAGSSNIVYFGVSVPFGISSAGNYIQTITVEDSC